MHGTKNTPVVKWSWLFYDDAEAGPMLPRMYDQRLRDHFQENRQMAFLAGLRQVGKTARCVLSPHLFHFQKQTGAEHAFQAVLDLPHEDIDCFAHRAPAIVPLRTLLSQLP